MRAGLGAQKRLLLRLACIVPGLSYAPVNVCREREIDLNMAQPTRLIPVTRNCVANSVAALDLSLSQRIMPSSSTPDATKGVAP